ncbi:MAG: BhlA/UviB family holin-like peptide, partial [Bacillota bacterium]|nr:BhlA/UviB family holin-like peptide [Bacillota bacterium]
CMDEFLTLLLNNKDYIFLVLFVYMLFYVLKTNGEREKKYQTVIEQLTDHLGVIRNVSDKLDKIEDKLEEHMKGCD